MILQLYFESLFTIILIYFKLFLTKVFVITLNFISLTSFLYLNGWIFYKNSIGKNLNNNDYIMYIILIFILLPSWGTQN